MELVSIDQTGNIYLLAVVRKKIDTKSNYLVITLPDGDVILHKIKGSKNPVHDFQRAWSTSRDLIDARQKILDEPLELAGKRGD
jgi:hypothetical protein